MKTKKFYRGTIVFVIVAVIVIVGSIGIILKTGYQAAAYTYHLLIRDYTTELYLSYMDKLFSEELTDNLIYHDQLMDINSTNLRISGVTYIAEKENLVKTENDYLAFAQDKISDRNIDKSVEKIDELYKYTQENGINFIYVACPMKGYGTEFPAGIENNIAYNCDRFYSALNAANIPSLILQSKMDEENISEEDAFFITDHHWKPNTGFWATGKILQKLKSQYGFDYNEEYCNIDNYNVKTYENWFLGSQGKKVGQYFTKLGVDDIDIITPKFETSFVESQPLNDKAKVRKGDFSQTLLFTDYIEEKNLYKKNTYGVYSGGDIRLQIYNNNNSTNGKKILVMRDSFGEVVTPFLSLHFDTVYSVDLRSHIRGRMINIYDTIEKYKPDYVVMLYRGVPTLGKETVLNY